MEFRKVTKDQMEHALATVNRKYGGNVTWNRFDEHGKNFRATLRVKSSKDFGAKLGQSGRHTVNACWHVHGDFFEALFKEAPDAIVVSMGKKITKDYGNWQDRNIGSIVEPQMYSEACECAKLEDQMNRNAKKKISEVV